jgi:predicted TIM-barrel fold metal-dependent hydrolase
MNTKTVIAITFAALAVAVAVFFLLSTAQIGEEAAYESNGNSEAGPGRREVAESFVSDYHVHILSPQLIQSWKKAGITFSRRDEYYADVDTIMNRLGIKLGDGNFIHLVAMGYLFSTADLGTKENARTLLQAENDYLASQKAKYPKNIKAYFSIDPLAEHAMDEIMRCHRELRLDGIKLHGNASQIYLTVPEHLAKVRTIFHYAAENNLPVLLHFDNSHRKFGERDVMLLADSILAPLPPMKLQIAHFGTSGGFNNTTRSVIDSFLGLFQRRHAITKHDIVFDISAVALDKDGDGVAKLTAREFESLAQYVRKLGLERIVFATDYPLYTSVEYLKVLKARLKLNEAELQILLRQK